MEPGDRLHISFKQIVALHTIARTGSMVAAADALGLSQPALSRMISQLEEEVGYRLFDRSQRRLKPTTEALHLMPSFERVIADMDRLKRDMVSAGEGDFGEVVIAGNFSLISALAVPAAIGLRAMLRNVNVSLLILAADEAANAVLTKRADIGLGYGPIAHSILRTEQLGRSYFSCILPSSHALSDRQVIKPEDLVTHPIVSYSHGSTADFLLQRCFESRQLSFSPAVRASNTFLVLSLVAQGAGIGIVDDCNLVLPEGLRLIPLQPLVEAEVIMMMGKVDEQSNPVRIAVEQLRMLGAGVTARIG
jgi:DNA-binding transcriptional LysR family regulator